jgi:hypothetical protein
MSVDIFKKDFDLLKDYYGFKDVTTIVDECFTAGTLISTPDGCKSIERLLPGDLVCSSTGYQTISATRQGLALQLVTLELSNGRTITCTRNHPIFTDTGWLAAESCTGRRVISETSLRDRSRGVSEEEVHACLGTQPGKHDRSDLFEVLRREAGALDATRPTGENSCQKSKEKSLRQQPQYETVAETETAAAQEENAKDGVVKVVSVTHSKQGGVTRVWNLQVAGSPHYFAEGVLVHNCQVLKNVSSQIYRKVSQFSAGRKLLLATGTELNNPGDAYSYIKLKTPSIYRSSAHFNNIHVAEVDFFGKTTKWQELGVLKTNLYLQSAKRTKEDVHKALPKATYMPIEYELAPAHKKLYDKLVDEMLLELPSGGLIDATTAVGLYTKSQQIIVNWSAFAGETGLRPAIFDVIDLVCEEIDLGKPGASKLILWTWFKKTTEAVLTYVNEKHPNSAVAAYSGADSIKSVARFLDDPACTVLVAQPGSAGAGLNPQSTTWECLFIEAPTRSIAFKQAAGRIDRQGQKYNPTIRVAIASGTVQQRMFKNLLSNDAEVMLIQNEKDLRAAIYGG